MRWLVLVLVAGCGGASPPRPLEVIPSMYLANKTLADVADGDRISLEYPPQGGHVLFVGARVKNLDDPVGSLRARLRSIDDDSILAEEERTVGFDPSPEDPEQKIPDLNSFSNVSNVPVCPSYSVFDMYDHPFILEVTVTAVTSASTGTARRVAVPSCLQSDAAALARCRCTCAANYVLGKCSG